MPGSLAEEAERLAREEIDHEDLRRAIDAAKVRIREKAARPWWRKLFPWRIVLIKLEK